MRRTVVISPHPDDETLGAGGLIAFQRKKNIAVQVIAVTDGEAAYGITAGLGGIRRQEQEAALFDLGVTRDCILRLMLPDSQVSNCEDALADALHRHVGDNCLVVAPWSLDQHPDHEACGRAAATLQGNYGIQVVFYLFWTWHRCETSSLTSLPLRQLSLSQDIQAARSRALARHQSQLNWSTGDPILPERLLTPAQRPFETFLVYA